MVKRSKSIMKCKSPDSNILNATNLEMEILALRAKNTDLSRTLATCRLENASLQKTVDYLQKERFESDTLLCKYQNVVTNFEPLLKNILTHTMGLSENFHDLMQLQNIAKNLSKFSKEIPRSASTSRQGSSLFRDKDSKDTANKAYPIKPHMVNGHILHIPTIKLTRVNEGSLLQGIQQHSQQDDGGEANENGESSMTNEELQRSLRRRTANQEATSEMDISDIALNESLPLPDMMDGDSSHLEPIQEESDTSPYNSRNSTVLSGVFQDVKIYLNQIPQEYVNRLCDRKSTCNQTDARMSASPYMCRPSLSERDRERTSTCAVPGTSRSASRNRSPSYSTDSSDDEQQTSDKGNTKIFRATLEKRSFSFTQTPADGESYFSCSHASTPATTSTSSMSSTLEEENDELNNSKLVVMKDPTSHRKLRSQYQDLSGSSKEVANIPANVTKRKSVVQESKNRAAPTALVGLNGSTSERLGSPIKKVSRTSLDSVTKRRPAKSRPLALSEAETTIDSPTTISNVNVNRGSTRSQKSDPQSRQEEKVSPSSKQESSPRTGSVQENGLIPSRSSHPGSPVQKETVSTANVNRRSRGFVTITHIVNTVAREIGVKRRIISPRHETPTKIAKSNAGSQSPKKSSGRKSRQRSKSPKRSRSAEDTDRTTQQAVVLIRRSRSSPKSVLSSSRSSSSASRKAESAPAKSPQIKVVLRKSSSPRNRLRPKRAARPKTLKEPALNKKMRR